MELQHSFTVPTNIDAAWNTLLDVERIAMCMPGATLKSVEGDTFKGEVKIKLGPVTMVYGGTATFLEKDGEMHRAVIEASGNETKNMSTAKATVVTQLSSESPNLTRVDVMTDLAITGKPAQFGRGVMQDVAGRIIGQFAGNLETVIGAGTSASATSVADTAVDSSTTSTATFSASEPKAAEAINILGTAGGPVLKRLIPIVGLIVAVVIIWLLVK